MTKAIEMMSEAGHQPQVPVQWVSDGPNTVCRTDADDKTTDGRGTTCTGAGCGAGKCRCADSLDSCKALCGAHPSCTGVEFQNSTRRCEIWTEPIGFFKSSNGYECVHKAPTQVAVDSVTQCAHGVTDDNCLCSAPNHVLDGTTGICQDNAKSACASGDSVDQDDCYCDTTTMNLANDFTCTDQKNAWAYTQLCSNCKCSGAYKVWVPDYPSLSQCEDGCTAGGCGAITYNYGYPPQCHICGLSGWTQVPSSGDVIYKKTQVCPTISGYTFMHQGWWSGYAFQSGVQDSECATTCTEDTSCRGFSTSTIDGDHRCYFYTSTFGTVTVYPGRDFCAYEKVPTETPSTEAPTSVPKEVPTKR